MSVGNGPLVIATRHEVHGHGLVTGSPVIFAWQWYYHLPSLAFWMLALVPLVVWKENRRLQAWAMLPALLVVLLGCRMLANLLSLSPAVAEGFTGFVGATATGWAIVWLVSPWLVERAPGSRSLWALGLMTGVGLLWSLVNEGWSERLLPGAIQHGLAAALLLSAMALASRFCGRVCAPGRFMAWLALQMALLPALLAIPLAIFAAVAARSPMMLLMGISLMILGALAGGLLYLANLPFMFVAFRTDLYRRRMCGLWRLEDPAEFCPAPLVTPVE